MSKHTEKLLNTVFNKTRKIWDEVHIMKFLKVRPWIKDRKTLLIEFNDFAIQTGKRTIRQMAYLMYNRQIEILENRDIPVEDCEEYITKVFIDRSLKGWIMEDEALLWLRGTCPPTYSWDLAEDHLDTDFNVDICGRKGDKVIYVQVKPGNFRNCDDTIKAINIEKERKLGHKIHYLYYDSNGRFSV